MIDALTKREAIQNAHEQPMPKVDVTKLVTFTANPQPSHWKVSGGSARWRGQIGRFIGVLSIKNARADAIVLLFDDNSIGCFNGIDLFPSSEG